MYKKYALFTLLSMNATCSLHATSSQDAPRELTSWKRASFTKDVTDHPILWMLYASLGAYTCDQFSNFVLLFGNVCVLMMGNKDVSAIQELLYSSLVANYKLFYASQIVIYIFFGCMLALLPTLWKEDGRVPSFRARLYRSFRFLLPSTIVSCLWYILSAMVFILAYNGDKSNGVIRKISFITFSYPFIINFLLYLGIKYYPTYRKTLSDIRCQIFS